MCVSLCDYARVCLSAQTAIQTIFVCAHVFTLPQLTGIIKSFLSSFPPLSAHSLRHSSSAPVCSCYAHCSLFFSPKYFLAVDFLLIPLLFMCHRQQSGVCIVVITNSKQPWALLSSLMHDASIIHMSSKIFLIAGANA